MRGVYGTSLIKPGRQIQETDPLTGAVIAEWHVDPEQAAEWAVAPEALAEDQPEPEPLGRTLDLPELDVPLVEHALAYVRAGIEVMPRKPGRKLLDALTGSPRTGFMCQDEVRAHWDRYPNHQIAAVLGPDTGLFVLDVDRHGDADGIATLAALEAEHGRLPVTPFVTTPRKGRHYYFTWPNSPIRTCQIAPGLEVLADTAAATLPPSKKQGWPRPYTWSLSRHPAWLPVATAFVSQALV